MLMASPENAPREKVALAPHSFKLTPLRSETQHNRIKPHKGDIITVLGLWVTAYSAWQGSGAIARASGVLPDIFK
jgi:hypothetical protein